MLEHMPEHMLENMLHGTMQQPVRVDCFETPAGIALHGNCYTHAHNTINGKAHLSVPNWQL